MKNNSISQRNGKVSFLLPLKKGKNLFADVLASKVVYQIFLPIGFFLYDFVKRKEKEKLWQSNRNKGKVSK